MNKLTDNYTRILKILDEHGSASTQVLSKHLSMKHEDVITMVEYLATSGYINIASSHEDEKGEVVKKCEITGAGKDYLND